MLQTPEETSTPQRAKMVPLYGASADERKGGQEKMDQRQITVATAGSFCVHGNSGRSETDGLGLSVVSPPSLPVGGTQNAVFFTGSLQHCAFTASSELVQPSNSPLDTILSSHKCEDHASKIVDPTPFLCLGVRS